MRKNAPTPLVLTPNPEPMPVDNGDNAHGSNELARALEVCEDDDQRSHMKQFFIQKGQISALNDDVFRKEGEVGVGNGGVVVKVVHTPSGMVMARKTIHLEIKPAIRNQILRELQVLHECNSPNIVGFYGSFVSNNDINICMEFMDGGSLDQILKKSRRIPEPVIGRISLAVLRGLEYLRVNHNIMHRDVKSSNILMNTKGHIKICDFGVSGQLIDSMANSFVGTRSYMAPERLQGEPYTVQSDLWSMGLSLVELALGIFPIPTPNVDDDDIRSIFGPDPMSEHWQATREGTPLRTLDTSHRSMAIFELLDSIVKDPPPRLPSYAFSEAFQAFVDTTLKKLPRERTDLPTLLKHEFVKTYELAEIDIGYWVTKIISIP